ncbi:hypothetical protein [Fodinicola feengrottensis]|uniref:hypothetical protein n=1 Tax=Fodinicola feengrottensis TaxID=435914 RepID=UPI0013D1CAEA|nr:hypothetical protein [Fodinicola feengrottensis]
MRAAKNHAIEALLAVPDGTVMPLNQVLAAAGVQVIGLGQRLSVRGGDLQGVIYRQWTPDLRPDLLAGVLRWVAADPTADSPAHRLLSAGIRMGEQVRAEFVRFTQGRAIGTDQRALEGVVALLYPYLMLRIYDKVHSSMDSDAGTTVKEYLALGSRRDFVENRAALTDRRRPGLPGSQRRADPGDHQCRDPEFPGGRPRCRGRPALDVRRCQRTVRRPRERGPAEQFAVRRSTARRSAGPPSPHPGGRRSAARPVARIHARDPRDEFLVGKPWTA